MDYWVLECDFATLSGSPLWGISEEYADMAATKQHQLYQEFHYGRFATPFGPSCRIEKYCCFVDKDEGAPDQEREKRYYLRFPTYGQTFNSEPINSELTLFYLLLKAKVKVLLVGGTSGSCYHTVQPGDICMPSTYLPTDNMPRGLPGTEYEFNVGEKVCVMKHPFCTNLAEEVERIVETEMDPKLRAKLGKFHSQDEKVILNRWVWGNGFESEAETCKLQLFCDQMYKLGRAGGLITGDCVSPVLARSLGICMVYYHLPSNFSTGYVPLPCSLVSPQNLDLLVGDDETDEAQLTTNKGKERENEEEQKEKNTQNKEKGKERENEEEKEKNIHNKEKKEKERENEEEKEKNIQNKEKNPEDMKKKEKETEMQEGNDKPTDSLDNFYLTVLPQFALDLECRFFQSRALNCYSPPPPAPGSSPTSDPSSSVVVPYQCPCCSPFLVSRPPCYQSAYSQKPKKCLAAPDFSFALQSKNMSYPDYFKNC